MKFSKWMWLSTFALMLTTPVVTSCGDEEDEKMENPNKPSSPNDSIPAQSPINQKEFLEETGVQLLDQLKASDFQNVVDLARYVDEYVIEENEYSEVEDWCQGCLEDIITPLGVKDETFDWGISRYSNYACLYRASAFTGHFVAKDGVWKYSKADDLQFTFNDEAGKTCVLKLTTSGKKKTVYAGISTDWYDYEYSNKIDGYIEYFYRFENRVEVPEKVVVTLTQGGKTVSTLTLTTDLSSMKSENIDLTKDSYSASASLNVNGYEYAYDKVSYNTQKNASGSVSLKRGNNNLLSFSISADGTVNEEEVTSAKNAVLSFKILDKVEVAGNCQDIFKLVEKMEKANDNYDDESLFKSYINEANRLINLKVYYNGVKQEQLSVKLEPFKYDDGWGYSEWYCEPVICFPDETSYSTFEAFFDEDDFSTLIQTANKLVEEFIKLVD